MQRNASELLLSWATKKKRKPLIINGARQTGKSWIVKELGKTHFKNQFVELNFEKHPHLNAIFEQDLDVNRIVFELEITLGKPINNNTLLFFDEIQSCPKAIMSLRYFYEDLQKIPVIAAGSLLEFQLKDIPFPVGRIEVMEIFPMTFDEFLTATGNGKLADLIQEKNNNISPIIEEKLYKELQNYFWVGGMPECVKAFSENKNYLEVRKIQEDLIYTYQQDFSKYNPLVNKDCLWDILNSISVQIGNQIIYSKLSERFTNPTIKKGVDVLTTAKIFRKVNNVLIKGLPFTVSDKQFKACFLDIGLLLCLSKVTFDSLFYPQIPNSNFIGMWAEQYVGQQLMATGNNPLRYWARNKPNSSAEVDYVIAQGDEIIPIEIKSGKTGKFRSLHLLLAENKNVKKCIIFSKALKREEGNMHFIPIYLAGYEY